MGGPQDTWQWRPEPGWLGLSLVGMTAGALVGALYVVVTVVADFNVAGALNGDSGGTLMGLIGLAVFGAVYGASAGLAVGSTVGLVLTFLVGRDMPAPAASVLTFIGAATTFALLLWWVVPRLPLTFPHDNALVVLAGGAAVGLVALWFRAQLSRTPSVPAAG